MTPEEKALAIAARIADGSAIDWADTASDPGHAEGDPAVLAELKAIAALATLHRAPVRLDDEPAAGSKWGTLTRGARIGEGRFGAVYLAWDARLHRRVALKLLHVPSRAAAGSPSHAIEEARLLARVRHPNVLMVHGAECLDGEVGIWTEFIEGRTLESLVADNGPLPPDEVRAIGVDLCDALSAVHAAGLLHRDVKAQNVMRETGGRIVLMDFGTSHDLEANPARAADLSGTPLYLAPELFAGEKPSIASDVYAVGVLLFYLLTGRYPFPGRTLEEVRTAHDAHRHAPIGEIRGDVPGSLSRAIERALAEDPAHRYADASAFKLALSAAARPAAITPRRRWARAMLGTAAVLLTIAALVTFDVGGLRRRWSAAPPAAATASAPSAGAGAPMPPAVRPAPGGLPSGETAGTIPSPVSVAAAIQQDTEPSVRRVRLPSGEMGVPSRDGRFMPHIDAEGNVDIWEVETARSRRVAEATPTERARFAVISSAGDRVVYGWSLPEGTFELRLANMDGKWPRVLIGRQTVFQPIPVDWSRDGVNVLCWLRQKDGNLDLAIVPVEGGAPRVLDTLPGRPDLSPDTPAGMASLSPDGRFAVYFGRTAPPPVGRPLFIVGTDGLAPRVLMQTVADDTQPRWSPDGRHVLFVRIAPGPGVPTDAWALPVTDGTATGPAERFATKIGPGQRFFVSDSGALYSQLFYSSTDVSVMPFDSIAGAATGPPRRISRVAVGNHVGPAWSPDGRSLAYFTTHVDEPGTVPSRTLTVQDISTGKERTLQPALWFLGGYTPAWLADSGSLIVWGKDRDEEGRFGLYRIDVHTSDTSPVVLADLAPVRIACSPDGRDLLYIDSARGIVARDLEEGHETVLVAKEARASINAFVLSPDGASLAFAATRKSAEGLRFSIEVVAADVGLRELVAATADTLNVHAWTPDGRSLVITRQPGPQAPPAVWLADVLSGKARDTHLSLRMNLVNQIRLSPDGRQLAYTERDDGTELWIRKGVWYPRVLPPTARRR
jgi:Tol biopolymer transport system component